MKSTAFHCLPAVFQMISTGQNPKATASIIALMMVGKVTDMEENKPSRKKFKQYPIGYFHTDIAELKNCRKLYLYVAIDRTSKFACNWPEEANQRTSSDFLKQSCRSGARYTPSSPTMVSSSVIFRTTQWLKQRGTYVRYAMPRIWLFGTASPMSIIHEPMGRSNG